MRSWGGKTIQARLQHTCQGCRNVYFLQAAQINPPRFFTGDDHAILDQHLDQFFQVKGIAFRAADHQFTQFRWNISSEFEDLRHQLAALTF